MPLLDALGKPPTAALRRGRRPRVRHPLPKPCYLTIGDTYDCVGLHIWECFQQADVDTAIACAEWITDRITQRIFNPSAANVKYDDFEILAAGSPLDELVEWPVCPARP